MGEEVGGWGEGGSHTNSKSKRGRATEAKQKGAGSVSGQPAHSYLSDLSPTAVQVRAGEVAGMEGHPAWPGPGGTGIPGLGVEF